MQNPVQDREIVMDFPDAMRKILEGGKITKQEWANSKIYLEMRDGFLCLHRDGESNALMVSEGDMIGEDWVTVRDDN